MVDYDVIVVGAGPAGSTAARTASKLGLSVLLLDKESFPRVKPCAGGVRFMVSELLDFDLTGVAHRKISGLSIFAPAGYRVDCIPEDRSKPGMTVMRDEFDHLLMQKAAEAGTSVIDECEVIDIQEDSSKVSVTTIDGETYSAGYVIGADGVNSTVGKQLGFYDGWKGATASIAIEMEVKVQDDKIREICGEPERDDTELIQLHFGPFPHGYAWCFPKRHVLSVGACARQDLVRNLRSDLQNWLNGFLQHYSIDPVILTETSARFPIRPAVKIAKGRALLVGDAAGFVDSFTGEGIPHAIHSGILAAEAVREASMTSNPMALSKYVDSCRKHIISELKVTQSMAKLFYKSMKNMETLCAFFRDDYQAQQLIASAVGGLLSQKEVMRKLTLRMLRKSPRGAISLFR